MNIFDIIGPVMVGPSSSHTAGAVRIGYIARKLLQEPVVKADILLGGSFLSTGKGHGTDKALVAGLLGMQTDDERIPQSLAIAREQGMEINFGVSRLKDAHPNTAQLLLEGNSGNEMEIVGESLGGGRINIARIDGNEANIAGDYPTLIIRNEDRPGYVALVTGILAGENINVATLQLYRAQRGGLAVMVVECDQEIPEAVLQQITGVTGTVKATYLSLEE